MILDRNQLVWLAIAEIRKLFGENQKPTPSRFFCAPDSSAKPQPADLSLIPASANHKALSPAYLGIG